MSHTQKRRDRRHSTKQQCTGLNIQRHNGSYGYSVKASLRLRFTFILLLSILRQVWQSKRCPCFCWVSMSYGSSQSDEGGSCLVGGEVAGELVSQLLRILEMMCDRLSQRSGDRQNFWVRSIIYQNTPLHPHPTPRSSSSSSRLFFFYYYLNRVHRRFMEKCLNGREREKGEGRECHKMVQFLRYFPRLRTITYHHNVYAQDADGTRGDAEVLRLRDERQCQRCN